MNTETLAQRMAEARVYWRLVVGYKWHILVGTFALTLVFAAIIAKLPSIYVATTTILVDPQQIPEKYVSPAVTTDAYSRLNTITQQVLSRTRLQEILDRLSLYPELRKSLSPEELIEKMRDDITILVKQGSGPELSTFTISYQGKQPIVVAEVANELAASFIQWNVNSREQQVAGTKEFLSSELGAAKLSLEQQEDQLRQFKMKHLGETPDQAANNLQALASLRSTLQANADAMNRLDEEKVLLTSLPASGPTAATPATNLTERQRVELEKRQLEASLQQLRERYSDSYPDVVTATRRLEELNTRLVSLPPDPIDPTTNETDRPAAAAVRLELIDREMKKLKGQQDRTQSQIDGYQARLDAAPLRDEQLVELTRNYEISKQNYQTLLDKSFSIDMAADLEQKQKGERFTVLDPAQVPEKPIKPARKILIPLSGLVALVVSIFFVLATEALSPAIKTEMELKSLLPKGARIVGLIPRIEIAADARRDRRLAISASLISALLCVALIRIIWLIRLVL
ncbi:MAG TPA: GNVR domain-containing protein [Candidatus Acidoferrales bacterium]|nr:GNVR domain-containing protein [Candidatus Acidoferrales bacterium]